METSDTSVYAFGPFRLDPAERRLLLESEPLALPPKVLDTLIALVEADGRLVAKEGLMQRLWPDTIVEEVNLARNVSLLRKALGEKDGRTYIETVPKSGYRFTEPITKVARDQDDSAITTVGCGSPAPTSPQRRPRAMALAAVLIVAASVASIAVWFAGNRGG